jgi:Glycosyl hydrolase family 26
MRIGRRIVLTATSTAVAVLAAAAFTTASHAAEASKVVPIGQRLFGAYVSGSTASQMESDVGRKLDVQSFFEDWSAPFPSYVRTSGRTALIAWEPSGINTQDVIDGRKDTYLRKWATAAKASGRQVFIRPWPEMNGAWAQWSAAYAGADKSTKSAGQLKSAWRHAHDIFRLAGASNVKWVFSPNETDEPSRAGNRLEDYYPGDSYVDVLGFDAYNWAGYNGIPRRTHQQIFDHIYPRLSALSATKPIWLAEGSASPYVSEADKAAWFAALLADTGYPRLEAYILFSTDKEQDWRYNSSPAVLNAFRKGLAVHSSTSTAPVNDARSGLTIARRSL